MLRAFAILALLLASASAWAPASASDVGLDRCDDDQSSCLETCTLEFGTSGSTRGKLLQCRRTCESHRKSCILARMDQVRREEALRQADAGRPRHRDATDAGPGEDVPIFE